MQLTSSTSVPDRATKADNHFLWSIGEGEFGGRGGGGVLNAVEELFVRAGKPAGGWTFTTKAQVKNFLLRELAGGGSFLGVGNSPAVRSTQHDGTLTDPDDVANWLKEEICTWAATDLSEDIPDDVRETLASGLSAGLQLLNLKEPDLATLIGLGALSRDDVRRLLVECGATCSKDDDDEDGVSLIEEDSGLQADCLLDVVKYGFEEGVTAADRAKCCDEYEITETVGQTIYDRCLAIKSEADKRAAAIFPKFVAPALEALDQRKAAFRKKKRAAKVQQKRLARRKLRAREGGRPGYFAQFGDEGNNKAPGKKDGGEGAVESKESQDPAAAAEAAPAAAAFSVNIVGEVMAAAAAASAAASSGDPSANLATGTSLVPQFIDGLDMGDHELLTKVSNTFVERARAIGMIIIADHFKPVEQRVFKPKSMGGIAGGTKYIEDGILFKLANPDGDGSPYGESFELANKAAGLDLSGAIAIMHGAHSELGKDKQLHVSLQALVDHLGFRVQVMTLLPLADDSLKVGSDDACTTIPRGGFDDTEKELNGRMAKVAKSMGLAAHEIKVGEESVELHFGADVECHLDQNGKARVLDTARVFPPENPHDKGLVVPPVPGHLSIYWRLLRPELID
eukprot:g2552.t1